MSEQALPTSVDAMLELLTSRGYLAERSLATVTYLSLRMGRPLFLEGEAGVNAMRASTSPPRSMNGTAPRK
jgi:MoxR-like ATPase